MNMPWNYRPPEGEPYEFDEPKEDNGHTDWEDNWVSNSIAWASVKLGLDGWGVLHAVANPFWTDCPTCLFWRGLLVGGIVTAAVAAII